MKIEGIILSTVDYKESSNIINIYTEKGKIGIKAIGAKNPKKGLVSTLEVGNILSFNLSEDKMPKILEYNSIFNTYKILEKLDKMEALGLMLDIISNIDVNNNHKNIYNFSKKMILSLNDNNTLKVLSIFMIKVLYAYGINPNLKTCNKCNSNNIYTFDSNMGGALCKNCSNNLDNNFLNIIKEYYYDKKEISEYTDCDFKELLKVIYSYYNYHFPYDIKLNKYIAITK